MASSSSMRNETFPTIVKPPKQVNRITRFLLGGTKSSPILSQGTASFLVDQTESSLFSGNVPSHALDRSFHSQATVVTEACSTVASRESSNTSSVLSSTSGQSRAAPQRTRSALKQQHSSRRSEGLRIRFSPTVEERAILSRHNYTDDELDACWFHGDEYANITKSCCKQIRKLEKGARLKGVKYCSRGLESHTQQASLAKAQNRRAAWDGVLQEQEEQISLGVVDDEPIALRYSETSASCQLWAIRMAIFDQREAELVYDDMLDEEY